ncbi:MAG: sulfatase-like hydrolase/transferase, partial [Planctomycetes bacterium]|nr:sulfatase-like hydrolase/transferase [Planctomycetota bacterium]
MTQAKFTRRNCFTVLCLATFLLPANLLAAEAKRKPNIVYILADDLGYADLGVFGSSIRTPNINALAA